MSDQIWCYEGQRLINLFDRIPDPSALVHNKENQLLWTDVSPSYLGIIRFFTVDNKIPRGGYKKYQ